MNYLTKNHFIILAVTSLSWIVFQSCQPEKKKESVFANKKDYQDKMILSHQVFLEKEKKRIEHFIDSLKLKFEKTGTGLRYFIEEENEEGDSIVSGDIVFISYTLESIYGDSLYQSPEGMAQEFAVDYDNVENGLHEGVKYMRIGERAILILPTHLAHGITGDQAAIGTQTTLIYRLKLLGKR